MFAAIAVWAVLQRRRGPLLLAVIIAAGNRESAAFAGVMWAIVNAFRNRQVFWFEAAFGAAVSAVAAAVVLGLRFWFRVPGGSVLNGTPLAGNLAAVGDAVRQPYGSWAMLSAAAVLPLAVWLWAARRGAGGDDRALLQAAVAITLVSLVFGQVDELRVFLLPLVIAILAAALRQARVMMPIER